MRALMAPEWLAYYSQGVDFKPSPLETLETDCKHGPSSSANLESVPSPAVVSQASLSCFVRSVSDGRKQCSVILKFVRPRLQSMLKFTVAEPLLGALTFSLLGPPVRSSVLYIEEGTLFCLQGALCTALSGPPAWGSGACACDHRTGLCSMPE